MPTSAETSTSEIKNSLPTPPSPSKPICVAIIGYSGAARTFHIPLLLSLPDLFHLHTIQQRPSSSGPPASKDHPNVRVASTIEAVFEGEDGDKVGALPPRSLVIISTSNETHTPFALQALKAGHHVVVEKPAALTEAEAESLKEESQSRGLVCAAFQNRRLDSDFITLRTLLGPTRHTKPSLPSPIGQPTLVESRFDRYRPFAKGGWREEITPEKGGGLLWDLGSHLIDQGKSTIACIPTVTYADKAPSYSSFPLWCAREGDGLCQLRSWSTEARSGRRFPRSPSLPDLSASASRQ